ncbi:MAG: hypothetical protein AB7S77_19265 [Desulfatirhabdiaceae bacterium]
MTDPTGKFSLFWESEDNQHSIPGGAFDTLEAAEKDIPKFKRELIGICADESEREAIRAGAFDISRNGAHVASFGAGAYTEEPIEHQTCWTEGNGTWHLMRKGNEIIKVADNLHDLAITQGSEDIPDKSITIDGATAERLGLL